MFTSMYAQANDFTYKKAAQRNPTAALTKQQVNDAKMQGECLVGLKELNFRKKSDFDPIAEWTTYRSSSLLDHLPPCEVLIIMQVAQKILMKKEK